MRIAIENLPSATMVPNEFIDRYMPEANGEYVKVFLYLLRHNGEEITPTRIADALELTEGDVRRALTRWQREGLIAVAQAPGGAAEAPAPTPQAMNPVQQEMAPAPQAMNPVQREMAPAPQAAAPAQRENAPAQQMAAYAQQADVQVQEAAVPVRQYPAAERQVRAESAENTVQRTEAPAPQTTAPVQQAVNPAPQTAAPAPQTAAPAPQAVNPAPQAAAAAPQTAAPAQQAAQVQQTAPVMQAAAPASAAREALPPRKPADFMKLRKDEEFTSLLYVLQRYLGIIFSQTNMESVAYLYDTLGMSQDLLIYTAEICAERKQRAEKEGRRSADRDWFRYFEKTALLFHEKGFRTTEEAREDDTRYRAAIHAVMNAFGKDCSYPGQAERALIEKWYNDYGFSAEVIGEACSIVKLSTGNINYSYADKILGSWHEAGIRTVDQARDYEARRKENGGGGQAARRSSVPRNAAGRTVTRFHNLEERDDDLDAYALQKMKKELEEV